MWNSVNFYREPQAGGKEGKLPLSSPPQRYKPLYLHKNTKRCVLSKTLFRRREFRHRYLATSLRLHAARPAADAQLLYIINDVTQTPNLSEEAHVEQEGGRQTTLSPVSRCRVWQQEHACGAASLGLQSLHAEGERTGKFPPPPANTSQREAENVEQSSGTESDRSLYKLDFAVRHWLLLSCNTTEPWQFTCTGT